MLSKTGSLRSFYTTYSFKGAFANIYCSRYPFESLSFVFKKLSLRLSLSWKKKGLFIPFILLTLLKVSLRRLRMSSRETIRLPFSSNWTGPVMPAISTLKKEEKQWLWLNLHEKVGISLKRVLIRTLFSGTENDFSDADAVQIFGDKLLLKSK